PGGLALSRQELALALAVLLLGLLMLATRRHPLAQAAGLMGAENAVLLAAIGAGLPGLLPLAAGGLAVVAAVVAGLLALWRAEEAP
ncbi:MAG: hydrogenase-4 component E, partial [Alphaproteobacteria bacterium]|nr:hydrogenase-4 component E [Alphaproteobacteria bacterium]